MSYNSGPQATHRYHTPRYENGAIRNDCWYCVYLKTLPEPTHLAEISVRRVDRLNQEAYGSRGRVSLRTSGMIIGNLIQEAFVKTGGIGQVSAIPIGRVLNVSFTF